MGTTEYIDGVALRSLAAAIPSPAGAKMIEVVNGVAVLADQNGAAAPIGTGGGNLVTNPSDTQNWDWLTGINGDAIGQIAGFGELIADASARFYDIQPNGSIPTSSHGINAISNPGGGLHSDAQTKTNNLYLGQAFTGLKLTFRFTFDLKSGRTRIWTCTSETTAGANHYMEINHHSWLDTSTQVTSLRIHADAANGVKQNSFIVWWPTGITA